MGWAFCGTDRNGREIGYGISATCDHEGCEKEIDRGLAYACGDMHGEDMYWCHRYFCPDHLKHRGWPEPLADGSESGTVCFGCAEKLPSPYEGDA